MRQESVKKTAVIFGSKNQTKIVAIRIVFADQESLALFRVLVCHEYLLIFVDSP